MAVTKNVPDALLYQKVRMLSETDMIVSKGLRMHNEEAAVAIIKKI